MIIGFNANPQTEVPPGALCRFPLWVERKAHLRADFDACRAAGCEPVLVFDRAAFYQGEWGDHYYKARVKAWHAMFPDAKYVQAGNEPDGTGDSSSKMTKKRYERLGRAVCKWFSPGAKILAAGLVGIDFTYLSGVHIADWADYACFHPYTQDASTMSGLIAAVRASLPEGFPLWATEVGDNTLDEHDLAVWFSGTLTALWEQHVGAAIVYRWEDAGGWPGVKGTESEAAILDAMGPLAGDPPSSTPAPNIVQVPSPNHFAGRAGHEPVAVVLHTMSGTLAGCDSWFSTPASQVSAHYGVGLAGAIHQYVDLTDGAWANGVLEPGNRWPFGPTNPNYTTVSIETEDNGNAAQAVTDAEFDAVLACVRLAMAEYPSITTLCAHRVISPQSRPNCPGNRWIASGRFADLAALAGLTPLA